MSKKNIQYDTMVSYFNSLLTEVEDELENKESYVAKPQEEVKYLGVEEHTNFPVRQVDSEFGQKALEPKLDYEKAIKPKPLPVAEVDAKKENLQNLLDTMPKPQVQLAVETVTETKVETKVEVKPQVQVEVKPQVQIKPQVQVEVKPQVQTQTQTVVQQNVQQVTQTQVQAEVAPQNAEVEWKNIEVEEQFTALFFKVAGVTLAVPLVFLGGIFEPDVITTLFGKPKWFTGLTKAQGSKVAVVDTAQWLLPDKQIIEHEYKYIVKLDKSNWCLQCDELVGTLNLTKNEVKWREVAGPRPWLSGIVKGQMCALLHVPELVKMLSNGVDVATLLAESE